MEDSTTNYETQWYLGTTWHPNASELGYVLDGRQDRREITHCFLVPASERTDACPEKHHEGENLADGPANFGPAQLAQFWVNEKPILHYLAMVSNVVKKPDVEFVFE